MVFSKYIIQNCIRDEPNEIIVDLVRFQEEHVLNLVQ